MPIKHNTHDELASLFPTTGWLHDYVKFTNPLEACPRFRFFTACNVLGAAINNQVWIHRGDPGLLPKLFPNLWVLLLAPPGRGHKSSTINMSVNCLTAACPGVRIIADKITPESLVKALSAPTRETIIRIGPSDAVGLVKASEFSVFFGKQQYNTGLVSLITDLYDFREEWLSETIMRGQAKLKNVCISVVGGSTPDWLQSMLPTDAFTGGFMSRFVLVEMPLKYNKRVALPYRTDGETLEWSHLVSTLAELSQNHGEMKWGRGTEDAYRDFYKNLKPTGQAQFDAYQERTSEQILKLAMLLALSQSRMKLLKEDIQQADRLLKGLMTETAPRVEKLTTHPRMFLVEEIRELLMKYEELPAKKIMKMVYRSLTHGENQFNEAMRILVVADMVHVRGEYGKRIYRINKGGKNNDTST